MSITGIRKEFRNGSGLLVDPFSVALSSPDGTYGVRRADTGAVVVSDGTAMVRQGTGEYEYQITDPAADLVYEGYLEIVWTEGDAASYLAFTKTGGGSGTDNLYDLLPQMRPLLPGCGDPVMEQALRRMGRDFLFETELWQEDVEFALEEDATEYDVVPPALTDVLRVEWARVGEAPVPAPMRNDWGESVGVSYSARNGKIVLGTAIEDLALVLVAGLVLVPRISCSSWPQWIVDRWGRVVASMAVWNCMAMPGKPWSGDRDAVARGYQECSRMVADAKVARVMDGAAGIFEVKRRAYF